MRKKLFIVAAFILTMTAFVGCGKEVEEPKACWEFTIVEHVEMDGDNFDTSITNYVYGTEKDVDQAIKEIKAQSMTAPGMKATYDATKKKVDKSKSDCYGSSINIEELYPY